MVTLTNMQLKEIILVESGEKIGMIVDLDINEEKGIITHLIVAAKNKVIPLFGKQEEIIIPWKDIVTVGSDVILIQTKKSNLE
ncbi:PRC-barrel domain protein [Paraliobacillus sp. PM-2]|uniref:YlmC/YmxH family sporulation protein n=1 Tax=Paraliobacillus sp. PM-2 TaxID=1462524 RepID=UPI00061C1A1B|nr:YlmC/YmxH family sporulation protein [Paraliobacillus sp. PM-2]CQR47780.1 PRC-barrel domain protein [Paraliobacillus sp. PM-2]